jgi:uncharacterized membrane protein YfcA
VPPALAAIVFLAFVVEAIAGFGATVVTVTLAAFLLPIDVALALFVPVNVLLSAYLVVRHFRGVDVALLARRVLPAMGVGVAGGMALSRIRNAGWLQVAFAAFVVILAASELVALRRPVDPAGAPKARLSSPVAVTALAGAGVIHGLFACGGPLVVWVVGREVEDKYRFRSTLSALWLVMNVVLVCAWAASGTVTLKTLGSSSILVLPLLLGIAVGERVHARLPERSFRLAVFGLLLVAGLALLVRSLRA